MARLTSDVRFALRQVLRSPGFAITAVVTLALAIGANTAIFTLLNQALLRALPVKDPGQLVVLSYSGSREGHKESQGGDSPGHDHYFSYPMYRDLRDNNQVFSGLAAAALANAGVSWNNHAEQLPLEQVSGNYFQTLGVQPAAGRLLLPSDETAEKANSVAVLSFDYWNSHLAQAPVVGKTMLINGSPFSIVGVAAPGFHSMVWGRRPDLYVPITMQTVIEPEWSFLSDHSAYWLNLVGRLHPGETAPQAMAVVNPLWVSLRTREFPLLHNQTPKSRQEFISRTHLNLDSGAKGFSPFRDDLRTPLLIMMGMVVLVMAMAVVNVASLLLVRAASRVREFSMRFALGATNWQVFRQLLAEGLLLGLSSAALGLIIAPRALAVLITWMAGRNQDSAFSATLDWRVLVFTVAAAVIASLLFSLAPALQYWNPRLAESLKQQTGTGSGGALQFRRTCVALQIGFSLLLIVGAGLFVRTIQNLRNVNPGFATDHLLTFGLTPEYAGYPPDQIAPLEQRALESLAALPGVRSVGATNDADLAGNGITGDVKASESNVPADEDYNVELPWVSDHYLQTLGIPLVAGRYFSPADSPTAAKVMIVNETFARHYYGSAQNALGHHVTHARRPETDSMIVGVVRDAQHASVREPILPTAYRPFVQAEKSTGLTYYVRTWQPPDSAAAGIRATIANLDPKLIVNDLTTLSTQIDDTISSERTIALLASAFGLLATLLAGLGLYGILAYSTAQRTHEIGIRMALGAQRWTVVRLILREILVLTSVAIAVTIPISIVATRALRSQLFNVSSTDVNIYAIAITIVVFVAALAALIPARRAASVDPMRALRTE
ncbi:MAG TPA: ABC transporter permease [Acidobacteriaceae bacterium]|nr:ABC transporter permease [Acidobacteriaceae bacterium]